MSPEQNVLPDDIVAVAADWARRCADGLSPVERGEFQAWVSADPRHSRALAKANHAGVDCDWSWQTGAADEILGGLEARARRRRRRRVMAGASAAVVLCVANVLWRAIQTAAPGVASPVNATLVVIRPEKLTLPDGSIVELKDGARISADFSGPMRAVSLISGTAYFQVTKDPQRPFVVQAGGLAVQAVGTAFTTELTDRGEQLTVLVTEGRVRVDLSAPSTPSPAAPLAEPLVSVEAGKSVVLPAAAPIVNRPIMRAVDEAELQEQTAWRIPKLEFTATRLREIIAQMNQHNRRQFVLGEAAVGDLRVSGILRADKMDTLTEMLENDFGVHAERSSGAIVLRRTK